MVVKVYISAISASKEIKKRQQRAQFLLDSLKVNYENIDITEPHHEAEKLKMKEVCKKRDDKQPLPPQFFNDEEYCGDWIDFENASETDTLPVFLKLEEATNSEPEKSEPKENESTETTEN